MFSFKKYKIFISIISSISILITSSALSMQVLGPHDSNIIFLLIQNFPVELIKQIPGYKTKEKDAQERDLAIVITEKNSLYVWDVKSIKKIYELDLNKYVFGQSNATIYVIAANLIEKDFKLTITVLASNEPDYTNTRLLTCNLKTQEYFVEDKDYFQVLQEYFPSYKSHAAYKLSYQPNDTISHNDYSLKIENNLVITHKKNDKKVTIKNIKNRAIVCADPKKDSPYIILHNYADNSRSFKLYNNQTGKLIKKIEPSTNNYFISSIISSQMFGDHHDFLLFRIKNDKCNKNLAYVYDIKMRKFVLKKEFKPYPENKCGSFEDLLISKSEDDKLIFVPNYNNIYVYKNPVPERIEKETKFRNRIKNNKKFSDLIIKIID